MILLIDPRVKQVFDHYPNNVYKSLFDIREAIIEVARELNLTQVEETLKWGEPRYVVKGGSTIRINWKHKTPKYFAIYFNCRSLLVETFKEIYGDLFSYQGNRAIIFKVDQEIPMNELKHCISLSFRYHKIKHLPLLGA